MKKLLKVLFYSLLALILLFGVFLLYATVSDYHPKEEVVVNEYASPDLLPLDSNGAEFSFLIWNIGYCGLNKEMDFFYSGGHQVYPSREVVLNNIRGVKNFLKQNAHTDFVMLQEVDVHSTRSYFTNQMDTFKTVFPDYTRALGKNYDVFYVPVPLSKPMGAVESGVVTYSRYVPERSVRHAFKGNFPWPKGLFMLDRCFLVSRYKLEGGKEFVLVNTHNSAYDDGSLKAAQMKQLKTFLLKEYQQGNYVLVGGDWNQCPPNFKAHFDRDVMDNTARTDIPADYLPEWNWTFSHKNPTNRRNKTAYVQGQTPTTVIDFFLSSPNMEALSVSTIDLHFAFSDHQPVKARFRLLP